LVSEIARVTIIVVSAGSMVVSSSKETATVYYCHVACWASLRNGRIEAKGTLGWIMILKEGRSPGRMAKSQIWRCALLAGVFGFADTHPPAKTDCSWIGRIWLLTRWKDPQSSTPYDNTPSLLLVLTNNIFRAWIGAILS
jgi:hypothetical protein